MFGALAWPYWVATWAAAQLGLGSHSGGRLAVGWAAEGAYLLALPWLGKWLDRIARSKTHARRKQWMGT